MSNMNLREGMRRIGILLGVCGAIVGGFIAYGDATAVWDRHKAYKRFESIMALPTMQNIAKGARKIPKGQTSTLIYDAKTQDIWQATTYTAEQIDILATLARLATDQLDRAAVVLVDLDGIKAVIVDKAGLVSRIELSTGESVVRIKGPSFWEGFVVFLFPILGFLIPFGAVRLLAWVGSGFAQNRQ
jgi:hypothetical protein